MTVGKVLPVLLGLIIGLALVMTFVVIKDEGVANFAIGLPSAIEPGVPFELTVRALGDNGQRLRTFSGQVRLGAVLASGQAASGVRFDPPEINLRSGEATARVVLVADRSYDSLALTINGGRTLVRSSPVAVASAGTAGTRAATPPATLLPSSPRPAETTSAAPSEPAPGQVIARAPTEPAQTSSVTSSTTASVGSSSQGGLFGRREPAIPESGVVPQAAAPTDTAPVPAAASLPSALSMTDATALAGMDITGKWVGAAWGDYDNDGDPDLYVSQWAAPGRLYRNSGNGRFVDVTDSAGVNTGDARATGVSWADYDNDGDLDLYVAHRGGNNFLYRNDGGTFTDVAVVAKVRSPGRDSQIGAWADYDNDGDLDLFVANKDGSLLYRNMGRDPAAGEVVFQEETEDSGLLPFVQNANANSAAWADYDSDGDMDLYV
ncbi:MAG: VCBS repeat-containing protein, partial [Deinococcus sp.]|nr:VCBS repeat-containing protein [Deinococcus sp.]